MQEYLDLGHARPVTPEELSLSAQDSYYLPMHGVAKDSSTTTKLCVVFNASARTTSNVSLNDMLCVGPTLHPTLDKILIKFRTYRVALTGDIGKVYREVQLGSSDRQLHRFLWRADPSEPIQDFCMNRVTFGVASSPYLAVKTLQQAACDHGSDSPNASWHVMNSFYVDDLLGSTDTVEEAIALFSDLRGMLGKAGFDLKKWQSNSPQVLDHIPTHLLEPMPTQDLVDRHSATYPKALGVAWDSSKDTMVTHIDLPPNFVSTKRGIISDVAKTFDVLGWLAPTILLMKILYQQLWEEQLGWDDQVPIHYQTKHSTWRSQLPILSTIQLPRCYFEQGPTLSVELHGFSDASEAAYAAVVYVRATYQRHTPTCRIVMSKKKVAPVNSLSMPRLELCGAALLSKVLTTIRQALNIPIMHGAIAQSSLHDWTGCLNSTRHTWVIALPPSLISYLPLLGKMFLQHKIPRIVLREVFHPLNSGITTCGGLVPPGCCQTQSKYLDNWMKQNLVH